MKYTADQEKWIRDYADADWHNMAEFCAKFNEVFGTNKSPQCLITHIYRKKVPVKTNFNKGWTTEQDIWLKNHINEYESFRDMAFDFNDRFETNYSADRIRMHCTHMDFYVPKKRGTRVAVHRIGKTFENSGQFVKGQKGRNGLPIGTIRTNSDGRPFIKVMDCEGQHANRKVKGHNYAEPFWKPLQKKLWEDKYGTVPDGYVVCSLNRDPWDTDITHIGIIPKKLTARMAKHGWWTTEPQITKTGIICLELEDLTRKEI